MIELGDFTNCPDKATAFAQASEIVGARALMPKRQGPTAFMVPDANAPGGYRNALSSEKPKGENNHE